MGCIYHIYSSEDKHGEIYIGQTSRDPSPTNKNDRPLSHFSGVYSNAAKNRENEMFTDFLNKHPLSSIIIEIYDESQNYGVPQEVFDAFFSEWSIDGHKPHWSLNGKKTQWNTNDDAQITAKQQKYSAGLYLDAAEIIHNYVYGHKGYKLMTHQMGGQHHVFRSVKGLVLNDTITPTQANTILDNNSGVIEILQAEFNKILKKQFETYKINNKTLLQVWGETAWRMSGKQQYWKDLIDVAIPYLQAYIQIIRDDLDKLLPPGGQFILHNKMKNAYSTLEDKFRDNFASTKKGGFNIVHAIVTRLNSNEFRKTVQKYVDANPKNISAAISKGIEDIFKNGLIGFIDGISFANFYELEVVTPINKQSWYLSTPNEIHITKDSTDIYGQTLRLMAYLFFSRCVNSVLQESPEYSFPRKIERDGETYYIVSTYRLSNALQHYYQHKVKIDFINNNWYAYCHEMLTLYTQRHGTMFGKPFNTLEIVNGTPLGIIHSKLEMNDIDKDETIMYPAFQFKDTTLEDMQQWLDSNINDIKIY